MRGFLVWFVAVGLKLLSAQSKLETMIDRHLMKENVHVWFMYNLLIYTLNI